MRALVSIFAAVALWMGGVDSLASPPSEISRSYFWKELGTKAVTIASAGGLAIASLSSATSVPFLPPTTTTTTAAWASSDSTGEKLSNLSDERLREIVLSDVRDRSFLTTGRLTREIYDESATFTDEIDTYGLDQWMRGTQKLFRGDGSDLRLIGDINVSSERVDFRFDEDLMFNIPFHPVVSLSGKVILQRDANTGLITSYREFWDQDVASVLRTAKF